MAKPLGSMYPPKAQPSVAEQLRRIHLGMKFFAVIAIIQTGLIAYIAFKFSTW